MDKIKHKGRVLTVIGLGFLPFYSSGCAEFVGSTIRTVGNIEVVEIQRDGQIRAAQLVD